MWASATTCECCKRSKKVLCQIKRYESMQRTDSTFKFSKETRVATCWHPDSNPLLGSDQNRTAPMGTGTNTNPPHHLVLSRKPNTSIPWRILLSGENELSVDTIIQKRLLWSACFKWIPWLRKLSLSPTRLSCVASGDVCFSTHSERYEALSPIRPELSSVNQKGKLKFLGAMEIHCRFSFNIFILAIILLSFQLTLSLKPSGIKNAMVTQTSFIKRLNMAGGFGGSEIPRPKIIVPSKGKQNSHLEKFLMMYTCKICDGRNAQMVRIDWSNHYIETTQNFVHYFACSINNTGFQSGLQLWYGRFDM